MGDSARGGGESLLSAALIAFARPPAPPPPRPPGLALFWPFPRPLPRGCSARTGSELAATISASNSLRRGRGGRDSTGGSLRLAMCQHLLRSKDELVK